MPTEHNATPRRAKTREREPWLKCSWTFALHLPPLERPNWQGAVAISGLWTLAVVLPMGHDARIWSVIAAVPAGLIAALAANKVGFKRAPTMATFTINGIAGSHLGAGGLISAGTQIGQLKLGLTGVLVLAYLFLELGHRLKGSAPEPGASPNGTSKPSEGPSGQAAKKAGRRRRH